MPVGLASAGAAEAAASGVFRAPFGEGRVSVMVKEDLADAEVRVAAESEGDLAAGQARPLDARALFSAGP